MNIKVPALTVSEKSIKNNKHGVNHYIFEEVAGQNFQIVMFFLSLKIIFLVSKVKPVEIQR